MDHCHCDHCYRHGLMQERQRQRRLLQQRHDAEGGLKGHGDGEQQRARARRPACPGTRNVGGMQPCEQPELI